MLCNKLLTYIVASLVIINLNKVKVTYAHAHGILPCYTKYDFTRKIIDVIFVKMVLIIIVCVMYLILDK